MTIPVSIIASIGVVLCIAIALIIHHFSTPAPPALSDTVFSEAPLPLSSFANATIIPAHVPTIPRVTVTTVPYNLLTPRPSTLRASTKLPWVAATHPPINVAAEEAAYKLLTNRYTPTPKPAKTPAPIDFRLDAWGKPPINVMQDNLAYDVLLSRYNPGNATIGPSN